MPGVSRGLLVNLWSVAPREFSCDPMVGRVGRGGPPGILVLPHPQNKLINSLCYMHLALAKPGGHNINYLGGGGTLNAMFWARLQPPHIQGKDSGPQRHIAATLATSDV